MIKKMILMLLVLVGGVMSANASYYIGAEVNGTWTLQGELVDDDADGTYSLIVNLPQQENFWFTIFSNSNLSWDTAYRPNNTSSPWISNSVCEINMLESNSNNYSINYPIGSTDDTNGNYARAIKIDYTPSSKVLKVSRLIAVASNYNNWSTETDFLFETSNGSKIYSGKVFIKEGSGTNDGFKFVAQKTSEKKYYGYKADGSWLSDNEGVNATVSSDGLYELTANFSNWRWVDPTLVTVPVTMTYPYATFSSKYALDFTNVTYVRAYQASMSGTKVLMTRVSGKVPANTGLFLARQEGETSEEIPTTIYTTELTGNLMKASTGKPVVSDNLYSLVKRGDDYGFAKVASGYTWAEGKAYLETSATVNAPSLDFSMDDDETTTIHSINIANNPAEEGVMYNLEGKRIDQPSKGVYIVNGKKVIIK